MSKTKQPPLLKRFMQVRGVNNQQLASCIGLSADRVATRIKNKDFRTLEVPKMAKLLKTTTTLLYLIIAGSEEHFNRAVQINTKS